MQPINANSGSNITQNEGGQLSDPNFDSNEVSPPAMFDHTFVEKCNDRATFLIQTNEYNDAIDILTRCEQQLEADKKKVQKSIDQIILSKFQWDRIKCKIDGLKVHNYEVKRKFFIKWNNT